MAFKKISVIWLLITGVSAALFYFLKTVFKGHPLWPWAVPYLYIGVLILFALYVLTAKKKD
jgi:VIT1/CCC1 family predicted Fe2+/Mn2+ transporter